MALDVQILIFGWTESVAWHDNVGYRCWRRDLTVLASIWSYDMKERVTVKVRSVSLTSNVHRYEEDPRMVRWNSHATDMHRCPEYLKSKFGVSVLKKPWRDPVLFTLKQMLLARETDIEDSNTKSNRFRTQKLSAEHCKVSWTNRNTFVVQFLEEFWTSSNLFFIRSWTPIRRDAFFLHETMRKFCREVKNINRGIVVMAPHPLLYDGTRRAMLSVRAAESILRLVFRSKCNGHESQSHSNIGKTWSNLWWKTSSKNVLCAFRSRTRFNASMKRKKQETSLTWNLHGEETRGLLIRMVMSIVTTLRGESQWEIPILFNCILSYSYSEVCTTRIFL